ncbi:MAG: hypothetical protein QM520_05280 [Gammaproteobacteria bacterium]|nr:hypothetical protein [Gammaproteobacteria bacterium]
MNILCKKSNALRKILKIVAPSALPLTAQPCVMWFTPDEHLKDKTVAPSAGAARRATKVQGLSCVQPAEFTQMILVGAKAQWIAQRTEAHT